MEEAKFQAVFASAAVPEGRMRTCTIHGREILICVTKQGVHALDNVCTHAYARMSEGRLRGIRLICPLHGASFDVRDGRVLGAPATEPLVCHRVRIVNGTIEVEIAPASAPLIEASPDHR